MFQFDSSLTLRIERGLALIALMAMVIHLTGCGASVVGRWKNSQFQPLDPEMKGPGMLEVNIREDKTYTAVYESKDKSIKRGAAGQWDQESEGTIRLIAKTGDGPAMTNASLEDNNTLLIIGKGFAEKLKRD